MLVSSIIVCYATAPTVNADGSPRPTYINLPQDNEGPENENDRYNIEILKANRLKKHAYDEIDSEYIITVLLLVVIYT